MIEFLKLFWLLVMGHFVADYILQSDTLAKEKNFKSDSPIQKIVPWYYWMVAHVAGHVFFVTYLTGSIGLGVAEFVLHIVADYEKCAGKTTLHQDQAFHIFCKFLWAAIAIHFWG